MINIPILLKLIEGMNHKYNGHNSYFSLKIYCQFNWDIFNSEYQLNAKNENLP